MTKKKNLVFHARNKHIKIRHHFIRQLIEDKEIKLELIPTNDQLADILTNVIPTEKIYSLKKTTRNYKLRRAVKELKLNVICNF